MSYEKSVTLDPKLDFSQWNLGILYLKRGEIDLAKRQLQILRDMGSDKADPFE